MRIAELIRNNQSALRNFSFFAFRNLFFRHSPSAISPLVFAQKIRAGTGACPYKDMFPWEIANCGIEKTG
jgi:hypothetical protein